MLPTNLLLVSPPMKVEVLMNVLPPLQDDRGLEDRGAMCCSRIWGSLGPAVNKEPHRKLYPGGTAMRILSSRLKYEG